MSRSATRNRAAVEEAGPHALRRALLPWPFALAAGFVCILAAFAAPSSRSRAPTGEGPIRQEPITPIPGAGVLDPARTALGEALFGSPLLSRRGDRSCASCHDTSANGATGAARDRRPDGKPLPRNTNTVFNAALSFRLNWMGTAGDLEEQAEMAILNPDLMDANWPDILLKLNADPAFSEGFRRAYGRRADREAVIDALAAYERTLVTPDSRFDLWLKGDDGALTGLELDGYRTFKSIGCASCHQGVNVGANLYAPNGVFAKLQDEDPRPMRVPSLRNVAATAPYFHDGSAQTLEEAVQRMGAAQLGRDLTPFQISAIAAFLDSLTGWYRGGLIHAPPDR